jgi:hypothetical protein
MENTLLTKPQDRSIEVIHGDDVYTFDEAKHAHVLNGKPLHGVTTVMDKTLSKPALIPWAVKVTVEWIKEHCLFISNELNGDGGFYKVTESDLENAKKEHSSKKTNAGAWGTRVHNACEVWCETGQLPTAIEDEDILKSVENFKDFIETNGFKVLGVERPVWSKEWWIGGIFDLVLEKDGKVYIADIKTSSGIYDSHFIQMGAYYKCLLENGWQRDYGVEEFTGAIVINLKKDSKIAWCKSEALDTMVECYRGIVSIHKNKDVLEKVTKAVRYGTAFY